MVELENKVISVPADGGDKSLLIGNMSKMKEKDWAKIGVILSIVGIFLSLVGILLTLIGLEKEQVQVTILPSPLFIFSLLFLIVAIYILWKKKDIQFFSDRDKVPKNFHINKLLKYASKKRLNLTVIGRNNTSWFEDIDEKKELYKKALERNCRIKFIIQNEFVENSNIKNDETIKKIKGEIKDTIQKFKIIYETLKAQNHSVGDNFKLLLTSNPVDNSMTVLYENDNFLHFSYDIGLNIDRNPYLVFLNNSVIPELKDKFSESEKNNCIDIFKYEEKYNEGKNRIDKLIQEYSQFSLQRDNQNRKLTYHYFEREKYVREKEFYPPVSIQLLITSNCTTNCIMCDHHSISSKDELSENEIEIILDYINDLGTKNIIISGGEPLFRDDCIEILEAAKSRNLNVGLLTNGIKRDNKSITSDDARRIKKACDWVQLSIDSFKPNTYKQIRKGDFDIVKESIGNLEAAEVNVEIVFTIQKLNIDEATEIINAGKTIFNNTKIRFKFAHGPNNSNKFLLSDDERKLLEFERNCEKNANFNTEYIKKMFAQEYFNTDDIIKGTPLFSKNKTFKSNRYVCHAIKHSCKIDAEGYIYPCCFLYDDNVGEDSEIRSKYNIGSLRIGKVIHKEENRLKKILSEKADWFKNQPIPLQDEACNNCTRHFYQNAFLNELDKIVREYKDIDFIDTYTQEKSDNSKIWI